MEHLPSALRSECGLSQYVRRNDGIVTTSNNYVIQVREAAQLTHVPDGPLFMGDGSLAAAPTPSQRSKGIRPVLKVVDDKCL